MMVMAKFNPDAPVALVVGREPLAYQQGSHGFNSRYEYLGEYNGQGEPVGSAPKPEPELNPDTENEREALLAKAAELGLKIHPRIGTEKLRERVEAAENDIS